MKVLNHYIFRSIYFIWIYCIPTVHNTYINHINYECFWDRPTRRSIYYIVLNSISKFFKTTQIEKFQKPGKYRATGKFCITDKSQQIPGNLNVLWNRKIPKTQQKHTNFPKNNGLRGNHYLTLTKSQSIKSASNFPFFLYSRDVNLESFKTLIPKFQKPIKKISAENEKLRI